jgi:hypothetical protein
VRAAVSDLIGLGFKVFRREAVSTATGGDATRGAQRWKMQPNRNARRKTQKTKGFNHGEHGKHALWAFWNNVALAVLPFVNHS